MKNWLIFSLLFLVSCSYFFRKKTERLLARVYNEYLYESELKGVIPPGTKAKDSLLMVRNFVDAWVHQKLILHQAELNLPNEKKDFTRQLENYRNSLVIYEYENELVKQKLDTVVGDEEIETYYAANQANFLLKDNIVQIRYVKLPLRSTKIKEFKELLYSGNSEDITRLSEFAEKFAVDYFFDDQNWLVFDNVLKQIPIKTYNQEDFLKYHRDVECQDSLYYYIVRFRDFKIKESVSPLSLESQRIRNIILNKRKIELINKMHQDVFDNAQRKNDFEIFKQE